MYNLLMKKTTYNEIDAVNYMNQILQGVQYCHIRRILHRDLKPGNILLVNTFSNTLKIGDFGLAIELPPHKSLIDFDSVGAVGTKRYMAPEVYYDERYGTSCDVWSCGTICKILNSTMRFNNRITEV